MPDDLNQWLSLIFRWTHVVAGVLWIGHLYFFNFVNAQVAKTYDADSKKKVVPELMPRALYWFRWGAMYTLITGILLLAFVYYMGGALVPAENALVSVRIGSIISLVAIFAAFFVYDVLWKSPLGKSENTGVAVSFVLAVAAAFGFSRIYSGRALFIHMGSMFGVIMAMNVWMRIWPAQRKIISAIKDGKAPDAALPALAGLRSKHNTYLSVPLIFFMISNHYPTTYGNDFGFALAALFIAVGWATTKFLYTKSAADAPKSF